MLGDVVAPLLTSFDFFARRVYKVDDEGCDAKDEYEYNLDGEGGEERERRIINQLRVFKTLLVLVWR